MVTVNEDGVRNVEIDLFTAKNVVNAEVMENLLYFVCNNGGGDKVLSEVTDPSRKKTFLTILFRRLGL